MNSHSPPPRGGPPSLSWKKVDNASQLKLTELVNDTHLGPGRLQACGRREMRTMFTWGNMKERDHVEHWGVHGRVILKRIWQNCQTFANIIMKCRVQ